MDYFSNPNYFVEEIDALYTSSLKSRKATTEFIIRNFDKTRIPLMKAVQTRTLDSFLQENKKEVK